MTFNVYSLSIAFGVIFLIAIIELVRKNKLLERYSLVWIFFGVGLMALSSTPLFIEKIAAILDIKYAPSVLFLLGLVFLSAYSLNMTIVFSKQSQKITRLCQEVAILKEKLDKLEKDNK